MAAKLGILVIHGMGNQNANFAEDLRLSLADRLGADFYDVAFEPCLWADVLQRYQDQTWEHLLDATRMEAKRMRHFVVSALGDPLGYISGYYKPWKRGYLDIHRRVRVSLRRLELQLEPGSPLIVLAHSLGSVIMNNYIWDEQKPRPWRLASNTRRMKTPFQRLETLTSFITYGSNIPLFLPPQSKTECITFPSLALPERFKPIAKWINLYDPDDILGYPLNTVWTDHHGTFIHDQPINAGLWPFSETILSHALYHKDATFLKIVVEQVRANLDLSREFV